MLVGTSRFPGPHWFEVLELFCSLPVPSRWGKVFPIGESGTLVHLHTGSFCTLVDLPRGAGMLHTKSFPRQLSLEGAHHYRCGKCNAGLRVSGSPSYPSVCTACPYQCAQHVPISVHSMSLSVCTACPYQCAQHVPISVHSMSLSVCTACPYQCAQHVQALCHFFRFCFVCVPTATECR